MDHCLIVIVIPQRSVGLTYIDREDRPVLTTIQAIGILAIKEHVVIRSQFTTRRTGINTSLDPSVLFVIERRYAYTVTFGTDDGGINNEEIGYTDF